MAVDPSIIFQIGKGVTPLLSPADIQNQQLERESGLFKMNALRQSAADDLAQRNIYRNNTPDMVPNKLLQAGLVKPAMEYQKFQSEQRKSDLDQRKTQVEIGSKTNEALGGPLKFLADNPSLETADTVFSHLTNAGLMTPQQVASAKQQIQSDPTPDGIKRFAMMGVQAAISAEKQATLESQRRGQDISMRGQDLSRQTALETNANTVGVARDRLAYDQGQPKGQVVQTENGPMLLDARTGQATPIMAGGVPIKGASSSKMTEDQGKATGWLVQAENAFKNMQASGFDAEGNPKSAAKPGYADAIATIPFGGAAVGNSMRTPERQKFVQAASSLSESLLRAATGAGVNRDEAKQKIEELTPQWGEDDTTTKQKMAAIPLYIESLKVRAGPGAAQASAINAGNGAAASGSNSPRGGIARPANEAAFSALPSGTLFIAPDGTTRRKP